ncbi:5879_t:CDS:2, partial [Gigaspora rosea]
MINSILRRHTDNVTFDNIITPTKQEWKQFYDPIPRLNKNMFANTTQKISIQEVTDTISKAPLKKAT